MAPLHSSLGDRASLRLQNKEKKRKKRNPDLAELRSQNPASIASADTEQLAVYPAADYIFGSFKVLPLRNCCVSEISGLGRLYGASTEKAPT